MGVAGFVVGGAEAQAKPPTVPLQYSGGPVLRSFTIYSVYYGNWTSSAIIAQQTYLGGLANYISGVGAPAGQQPMMKQYGVHAATVGSGVNVTATPTKLSDTDIRNIITDAQIADLIPPYRGDILIMVFPAHGFTLTSGCAYHSDVGSGQYYGVVTADCGPTLPLVTAHEVFEAASDPDAATGPYGWHEPNTDAYKDADDFESIDPCSTIVTLPFGAIPGAVDDADGSDCSATNCLCSTTGFTRQLTVTQVATTSNTFLAAMTLDDPALDGNPNALAIVTPNWNPGGTGGAYLNHPIGVMYDGANWNVFNEDGAMMPAGVAFNVRIDPCGTSTAATCPAFVHTTRSANTSANYTEIDDPRTNGNPNLSLLVTHNMTPGGVYTGTFVDGPFGVFYDLGSTRWVVAIQNEGATMPIGTAFNVFVEAASSVTAGTSNTIDDSVLINAPLANGRPNARVVVTAAVGSGANIGVWYDPGAEKWAVFNQDRSNMVTGAQFNFLVE
jgi:hypothetical protein